MNLISRMLHYFVLLTALLLTCISLSADWFFGQGGLGNCLDEFNALLEAERKGEQLQLEAFTTAERVYVKAKVAAAVKNSEMTLIEAAAVFRSLYEDPKTWHDTRKPRPGFNDGEGWCREVIEWTQHYLFPDQSTSQAQLLRQRLEAELREQMNRKGVTKLAE